jgi:hypothetical protein
MSGIIWEMLADARWTGRVVRVDFNWSSISYLINYLYVTSIFVNASAQGPTWSLLCMNNYR